MIKNTLRSFSNQVLLLNKVGEENKQGNNKNFISEEECQLV
jgi:hypothetical protein